MNLEENDGAKFCSECGRSLRPLDVPHLEITCDECGRTAYVKPPPGEGGRGIVIPEGTKFTIPGSWLSLSLEPGGHGKLFRPGVRFLVRQLLTHGYPKTEDDLEALFEIYKESSDKLLEQSELLEDLDLEDESDAQEAVKRIDDKKGSREWWAMMRATFCLIVKDALDEEDARKAAWAMWHATVGHAMTVYLGRMEGLVWRGYLASQVVYESAAAAARTSAEAEAIRNLEPLFEKQRDSVLYAWTESGEPIGPKIGVTEISEDILHALARFRLAAREQQRENDRSDSAARREVWKLRFQGAGVAAAIAGVLLTIL